MKARLPCDVGRGKKSLVERCGISDHPRFIISAPCWWFKMPALSLLVYRVCLLPAEVLAPRCEAERLLSIWDHTSKGLLIMK